MGKRWLQDVHPTQNTQGSFVRLHKLDLQSSGNRLKRNKLPFIAAVFAILVICGSSAIFFSRNNSKLLVRQESANKTDTPTVITGTTPAVHATIKSSTSQLSSDGGDLSSSPANIDVKINGQHVQVPSSGIVHKDLKIDGGTAAVDLNIQTNNTASDGSMTIDSNTSSYTSTDINTQQTLDGAGMDR